MLVETQGLLRPYVLMSSMFETDVGIHWGANGTLINLSVISQLSNVERSSVLTLECCLTIAS